LAGTYFSLKKFGKEGGVTLFGQATFCLFILHFLFLPKLTIKGISDWKNVLRGFLFGFTQVCLLRAQSDGLTSTVLLVSTMGNVVGMFLGRAFLKEKVSGVSLAASLIAVIGVVVNFSLVFQSRWAVLGGLIQGISSVIVRSLMIKQRSIPESVGSGFLMGSISTLILVKGEADLSKYLHINVISLVVVMALLLVVQYAFFYLYRILDSQRASVLALSRVPFAFTWDCFFLGASISYTALVSGILIATGALLTVYDSIPNRIRTASPYSS
jgi:drug/metabolite transporter (DMT)-like permease